MSQPLIPFGGPLEGESELSWGYFQHYRDIGPQTNQNRFQQNDEWEAVLQLWEFKQHPKKVNLPTTANIKNARLDNVKSA